MNITKISIIIVNFNGERWLKKCLDSILAQTFRNYEILIIDNASTDKSVDFLKKNFPQTKLILNEKNLGFAKGNNQGIDKAKGKYILLLNNDTWVDKNFLEKLLQKFLEKTVDVIGPTESKYSGEPKKPKRLTLDLIGYPVVLNKDSKKFFFLSGACLFFEKKLYLETKGLDEDFFMYFEETDWFWRLHLLKKKIHEEQSINFYHAGADVREKTLNYHRFLWRNQNNLQMLLKNYSLLNLAWVLPLYILGNIFEMIAFLALLKPQIALSYVQGWYFNLENLSRILEKRKWVQKNRKINDLSLMSNMYFGLGKLNHSLKFISNA